MMFKIKFTKNNMKEKITEILEAYKDDRMSLNIATQAITELISHYYRIFTIRYRNTWAVYECHSEMISAKDREDALNKFWQGKDKEAWDIISVIE